MRTKRYTTRGSARGAVDRVMTTRVCKVLALRAVASIAVILVSSATAGPFVTADANPEITLLVSTDRDSYVPAGLMHVRFLILNTGKVPIFLFRNVNQCTSQYGWLSLEIRDSRKQEIKGLTCSADSFSVDETDIVGMLNNPRTGVVLQPGEIYGRQTDYDVPKGSGFYYLHAK